ncbi:hypothetical protein AB0001_004823 [Salmonella enterica]|nr:hypothetical protein [Salmonella enterica]EEP3373104.1 hypothetical protein [Salmonella enterica]EFP6579664.1 hypothetical protein [Salmonella enterica]EGC7971431.1 hypothetical protein [Salmonella enterica]EIV4461656.1 hypothetical protein [Salmonella enterica]
MAQSISIPKQPQIIMTNGQDTENSTLSQRKKTGFLSLAGKGLAYLLLNIISMFWSLLRPIVDKLLGITVLGCGAAAYLFHHAENDKAFYITLSAFIIAVIFKALMHGSRNR